MLSNRGYTPTNLLVTQPTYFSFACFYGTVSLVSPTRIRQGFAPNNSKYKPRYMQNNLKWIIMVKRIMLFNKYRI